MAEAEVEQLDDPFNEPHTAPKKKKKNLFQKLGKGIGKVGKGIGKGVINVTGGIVQGTVTVTKGIGDGVVAVGTGIGTGVVTVGKGIGTGVVTVGKGIGDGVVAVGTGVGETTGKTVAFITKKNRHIEHEEYIEIQVPYHGILSSENDEFKNFQIIKATWSSTLGGEEDVTAVVKEQIRINGTCEARSTVLQCDPAPGRTKMLIIHISRSDRGKFGIALDDPEIDLEYVDGYSWPIPHLLVMLKKKLITLGVEEEGIFRVAANKLDAAVARELLEVGADITNIPNCDIHVVTSLLKIWFRELPNRILSLDFLENADSHAKVAVESLKDPELSVLVWLLDLCAAVAKEEEKNKMTAHNLAIVWAPNIFPQDFDGLDPRVAMKMFEQGTAFFEAAIEWRIAEMSERVD